MISQINLLTPALIKWEKDSIYSYNLYFLDFVSDIVYDNNGHQIFGEIANEIISLMVSKKNKVIDPDLPLDAIEKSQKIQQNSEQLVKNLKEKNA